LDLIARSLLEHETISGEEVSRLVSAAARPGSATDPSSVDSSAIDPAPVNPEPSDETPFTVDQTLGDHSTVE
jgi:hypothetical protein